MNFLAFVVLQIIIFIGLVMALRALLSRNVTSAAAHLQDLSAEYTRRQDELKRRLEESERQYQELMSRAKTEAEQLVSEAKQEAESARAKRLEDTRQESERIIQQAMASRDALRKELEREIDARAVERACELLRGAMPDALRQDIQQRSLEQLSHDGFDELERLRGQEGISEAQVVAATPLTEEQRRRLRAKLKEHLGRDLSLQESTDDRLVAGLVITVGSLVLDGSLASRIRRAIRKTHEQA